MSVASQSGDPAPQAEKPLDELRTIDDFEEAARLRLGPMVYDYYAGGADDEWTLRENRRAFGHWVLRPRVLVSAASPDLRTTVLGQPVPFPILLGPTGFHRLAHPEGELATARAAAAMGALMVVSTMATVALEDVAAAGCHRWFQLYVLDGRELGASLVRRAVASRYQALVLTVDTPVLGRRVRDERNRFDLPPGVGMANLASPEFPDAEGSGLAALISTEHDAGLTWDDLPWLRSISPLPLVLKGILTAEDTRIAVEAGVDGIIVSNHGGRQLDGVPATIDALPEVVEAAEGKLEVYLDGGVRTGSDMLKALGLGARAVMVGRPYLWGLAAAGEAGVRAVLERLRDDLSLAMALAGQPSMAAISRSLVAPAPGFGRGGVSR